MTHEAIKQHPSAEESEVDCAWIAVQVVFQYEGIEPIRLGTQHWTLSEDAEQHDSSMTLASSQHQWDADVYERLFLQPQCAQLWHKWNRCVFEMSLCPCLEVGLHGIALACLRCNDRPLVYITIQEVSNLRYFCSNHSVAVAGHESFIVRAQTRTHGQGTLLGHMPGHIARAHARAHCQGIRQNICQDTCRGIAGVMSMVCHHMLEGALKKLELTAASLLLHDVVCMAFSLLLQ